MKKIILPIVIVLLALCVLAGVLIYLFSAAAKLSGKVEDDEDTQQLEDYLASAWPDYEYESYDGKTLTLCRQLNNTFEQLRRFGASAGYAELAEGHLDTAALIAYGCTESCGLRVQEVVVRGISSDGQEAYRASTESGVTACWDSAP